MGEDRSSVVLERESRSGVFRRARFPDPIRMAFSIESLTMIPISFAQLRSPEILTLHPLEKAPNTFILAQRDV